MKAMVLRAPSDLVLNEVAQPEAADGQVLVRITHSGVCGTDYKIFNGSIRVPYPLIPGHEMAGEIAAVGATDVGRVPPSAGDARAADVGRVPPSAGAARGGPGISVGDRVIIDPETYDGTCFYCQKGLTNLCPNGTLIGRDVNGGFAEYLQVPASQVFRLPSSIDDRTAPMIQVLTTCLHAQRQVDIFAGDTVAVVGLGVTGQLHVQLARARGARVIGITRSAEKRAMAERLGADLTIPGGDDVIQQVREATDGRGADVIIETTGVLKQLENSVHMTRVGGKVLMFGIYTVKEGALPFYDLYFKEVSLITARVAKPEDYTACIALVERGQVKLEPLVSDVMPLGELKAAIGLLASDSGQRMKIILEHV
jgi:2-desacetyl-2-hydroxyethyl bacteriochlorophyllide A dehydrogenase